MKSREYRKATSFITLQSAKFRTTPEFKADLPFLQNEALNSGEPVSVQQADGSFTPMTSSELIRLSTLMGKQLATASQTEAGSHG